MEKFDLVVREDLAFRSRRLDAYLVSALEGRFSREEIKEALKNGRIYVNGKSAKPSQVPKAGDQLTGELHVEKKSPLVGEDIPVKVLYEDDDILAVDKPMGMVVHPGAGRKKGTLVHALVGRGGELSEGGDANRPGIVHRLDRDTSGVILVAKTNRAHRVLQEQFAARSLTKKYLALVRGSVEFEEGHIEAAIGRDPKIRTQRAVSRETDAREALTHYKVLERFRYTTYLEITPSTGRTHQIRVHLAHLGYPVLGDRLYGTKNETTRLMLHASRIEFDHPITHKRLVIESPLPDDFQSVLHDARAAV